jgi:hypothetical protein
LVAHHHAAVGGALVVDPDVRVDVGRRKAAGVDHDAVGFEGQEQKINICTENQQHLEQQK